MLPSFPYEEENDSEFTQCSYEVKYAAIHIRAEWRISQIIKYFN